MNQMIRWIGTAAMLLVLAGCGRKETQVVTPNAKGEEVAVWVDDVGFTLAQVQDEARRLFAQIAKNVPRDQYSAVQVRLLGQAVDNLVIRQLIRAEMARSTVLVTQEEVEQAKKELEKSISGGSLATLLANSRLTMAELEMNLRLDLFKNKVLAESLQAARDSVTEASAWTYYDSHLDQFTQPEGPLVSHIRVRVRPDADEAAKMDARAKAEGIRKALLEGADFERLAAEMSDCASRSNGGALGMVPRGREVQSFEDAVYGQEVGAIGEVVESPVGFHVIKVTGRQERKEFTFDEIKPGLLARLKAQAQKQVAAEYVQALREKATIKLDGALAEAVSQAKAERGPEGPAAEIPEAESAPRVTAPVSMPPPAAPDLP